MGTTANYSWPTPVATDLVKDGWEAIKDLGDAADTTVKAVSDAQGLVHINTTSFSAVASQSLDNVFSSTYDNYRIVFNYIYTTTTSVANLRLRVGGSDDSTNTYKYVNAFVAASFAVQQRNTAGTSSLQLSHNSGGSLRNGTIDIITPNKNDKTFIVSTNTIDVSVGEWSYGGYDAAKVFDGFSLIQSAGNMTGSISVYGYRKS